MTEVIISERERILITFALKGKVHHYNSEIQITEEGNKRDMLRTMLEDYQSLLTHFDDAELRTVHISK